MFDEEYETEILQYIDYPGETKELMVKEDARVCRILKRICDSMEALEQSNKLLENNTRH
ncbi:MAG: hypothetical protein WCX65_19235 [bacterium]